MPLCAYHPNQTAVDRCTECQRDICAQCKTEVAGKPVCKNCVDLIRSRVAAEMGATPSSSTGAAATPTYASPAGFGAQAPTQPYGSAQPTTSYQMPSPIVQEQPSPARMLAGIILGALFGAVGAFIWKTIAYYAHFELAYLDIIVGCAAGFGVVMGGGRQGIIPAILGALLGFGSMMLGYYLLMNAQYHDLAREILEKLPKDAAIGTPSVGNLTLNQFVEGLKDLSVIDWAFVAAGVYGGFIVPMKKKPQSAQG